MITRNMHLLVAVVCFTFSASAPSLATAETLEDILQTFKPYAGAGVRYDSNLFRLPDQPGAERDGKRTPSDTIYSVRAGVDGALDISKQNVSVTGEIYRDQYSDFDSQDHTGGFGDVTWNWKVAEQWDGELGYDIDRAKQAYENQTIVNYGAMPLTVDASLKTMDIRTRQNLRLQANYWVTRDWKAYVRGKLTDVSFNNRKQLDVERSTVGAGVDYLNEIGNRIGLDADVVRGRYDICKTTVTCPQADYDEYNFGPTANWKVTGKTRLRGRVRYTSRDYEGPSQVDFDGVTWRLTLVRNPEEPSNAEFAIYREISTLNDDISNYAVIDGLSGTAVWQLTGKIFLNGLVQYEERDFKGTGSINQALRKDKVKTAEAGVSWEINRVLTLSGAFTFEDRTSNRLFEEYDYNLLEIRLQGGF